MTATLLALAFLALCVALAPRHYLTRLSFDWRFCLLSDLGRRMWVNAVEVGHAVPSHPFVMMRRLNMPRAHPFAMRRQRQKMLALGVLEYTQGKGDAGFVRLKSRALRRPMAGAPPTAEAAEAAPGINEGVRDCRVRLAQVSPGRGQAGGPLVVESRQVLDACSVTRHAEEGLRERKKQRERTLVGDFSLGSVVTEPRDVPERAGARVQPTSWLGEVCPETPMEKAAWREILARAARWGPCLPSTLRTLASYVRRRPQLAVAWVLSLDGNPKIHSPWGALSHAIKAGWAPPQRDEDAARPLVKPPRLGADRGATRLGGVLEGMIGRSMG